MRKMFKSVFLLALLLKLSGTAIAQQDAMYSQYMFNTLAVNPAYAGSRNVISATALLRSQWSGIAGSPKTGTFTIDAPINNKHIGLGLQIFNDKLGISQSTGAVASYAYRIRMAKGSLSFGLQGGVNQYKADFTSVALDPSGINTDPAFSNNVNQLLYTMGAGVYYNSDKFYFGVSSPEIFNGGLIDSTLSTNGAGNKQSLHLFVATGYVFPLSTDFKLKPSVLFKAVSGAPIQADVNLTLWIKDFIAFGAQYRTSADISALVEIQLSPQIRFGYQYDRSTTPLVNFNSGSHEVMLRYEFGFDRGKIISPRYF